MDVGLVILNRFVHNYDVTEFPNNEVNCQTFEEGAPGQRTIGAMTSDNKMDEKQESQEKTADSGGKQSATKTEPDATETPRDKQQQKASMSPEDQEAAYEVKAINLHKTGEQNTHLNNEMSMQKRIQETRRRQQERVYSTRMEPDERLSRSNAIKLMRMYERRAKEAELRSSELQMELDESRDLAKRYHDMYKESKEKGGGGGGDRPKSRAMSARDRKENKKNESKEGKGAEQGVSKEEKQKEKKEVTEEGLDDDEAQFKRHIAKIAESKAMGTTSPIRVTDVIRKSEALILENHALKQDVQRLKWDNTQLIKQAKHASLDRDKLIHNISTSECARAVLHKRLTSEKKEHLKLNRSLTRQASDWIQYRKDMQEIEERRRWASLGYMKMLSPAERSRTQPAKQPMYKPRSMYPVEQYDKANH